MSRKQSFLLLIILTLSVLLRTWKLSTIPVELSGDEIDVGIQANSILKTGRDYHGNLFPIIFKSFDENRMPFIMYFTTPFIGLLGLNELGVRLPLAVMGVTSIALLFVLARSLFGTQIALIAAGLLSVSPWHIQFSRWSNDNMAALVFVLAGIIFLLKSFKSPKYLYLSTLAFSVAVYTYNIVSLFLLLFSVPAFLIYRKNLIKIGLRRISIASVLGILILIPFIFSAFQSVSSDRFSKISVFSDNTIIDEVINRRNQTTSIFSKYFRNKYLAFTEEITFNYLRAFSTDFLFFQGDPILRHSTGGQGEIYLFETFTLLLGLSFILRNLSSDNENLKKGLLLVITWLALAPIPSALTRDGGNHAGRLIIMLPPLVIFSALGVQQLVEVTNKFSRRKIIYFLVALLALTNISKYLFRYYVEYPLESWRFWQYGFKDSITYIKSQDKKLDRIFFNDTYETILPRFLFWYDYDPKLFHSQYTGKSYQDNLIPGFKGFKLGDKYYFGILTKLIKEEGFVDLLGPNDIYLASVRDEIGTGDWVNDPAKDVVIEKTIFSPTGTPIFMIISRP